MKKILAILFVSTAFAGLAFSQDEMKPPPPIDNKFFDGSVGNWVSDEYEMMGFKWTDEMSVNWVLNKQFLEIKSMSKSDKGMTYEQLGYLTADKEGNVKCWFFDVWGIEGASEFTGKVDGMACTMAGGNKWMKSKGKITVENNVMSHDMSYTMPGADGKETSGEMKVTYKKK
jgi:hypothetical protein